MELLEEISTFLQQGRTPKVKMLVQQAIDEGLKPQDCLLYTSKSMPDEHSGSQSAYQCRMGTRHSPGTHQSFQIKLFGNK